MPDESPAPVEHEEVKAPPKKAAPKPSARAEAPSKSEETKATPEKKAAPTKTAPRRPTLEPETKRLLWVRGDLGGRRPKFVRTASHRYWRIGRWESWRRPRGVQSKQRRHYGYRPFVVRVGYGGPRATRGLTPTGFRPVIIRTDEEIQRLDPLVEAAVIARTVGTRRRLVLEEACRKLGIHILNPIVREREES